MNYYYYMVYETIIESDIEILNLPLFKEDFDASVKIRLEKEPSEYLPINECGTYYSPDLCALGSKWGTMEVSDGTLMKIYIKEGYTNHDAAPFIIGWGFGFLFNQRGFSIFHCSLLNICGKGVVVSGVSGTGKSSTALSLIKSGAKYLADDMAIIDPKNGMEWIPSYPIQKVCRDVSLNLNEENLLHINEGRDKFSYHNESEYYNNRIKPNCFIILNIHDGEDVTVKEHTGIDKWMRVLECLFLNELFASFGVPDKEKFNCLMIAEAVRVLEISRPRGKNTVDKITEIINEFVNS